jgi:small-conductance mechanosensitive channel
MISILLDFLAEPWAQALGYVLLGILLGFLIEKVLAVKVRRLAKATRYQWDDMVVGALRGLPTLWAALLGVYLATQVGALPSLLVRIVVDGVMILAIGSVALAGMRLAGSSIEAFSEQTQDAMGSPTLVVNLAKWAIAVLGFFIILQNLGIQITPLITALGIGGLAVALALQDTLGNLFAGVQIILSRQVRPRDYVRLSSGEEGWVTDVKGRNTTINTFPDGNLLMVPNSVLASQIVKNYSLPRSALWVDVGVGVSYDSDLERVQAVAFDVATEVLAEVEPDFRSEDPIVLFQAFGASSVDFIVRLNVREFRRQGPVRHEFIKRLHRRFKEEGIEIPFPIRTVVMKGPGANTDEGAPAPD